MTTCRVGEGVVVGPSRRACEGLWQSELGLRCQLRHQVGLQALIALLHGRRPCQMSEGVLRRGLERGVLQRRTNPRGGQEGTS